MSLTRIIQDLKNVVVGLGWDVNAFDTGGDFDLDAAAFMLGDNGKCPTEKEFIFLWKPDPSQRGSEAHG